MRNDGVCTGYFVGSVDTVAEQKLTWNFGKYELPDFVTMNIDEMVSQRINLRYTVRQDIVCSNPNEENRDCAGNQSQTGEDDPFVFAAKPRDSGKIRPNRKPD